MEPELETELEAETELETELETEVQTTTAASTTERVPFTTGEYSLNNSGSGFDWIFVYYFVVIALIFGCLLFVRKYLLKNADKLGGVKSGNYMRILDRLVISQDKQIIMVEAGDKILLIGASAQRVETLAEYPKEEFSDIISDINNNNNNNNNNDNGPGSFGGNFLYLLGKKLNIKDKDGGKK